MKCPSCGHPNTSVVDSRVTREGREIRRRRSCEECSFRFTTYERIEERVVYIAKKDGRREAFNRDKILTGLRKASEKLEIESEEIELAAGRIARRIYDSTLDEVPSSTIGEYVMEELFNLDEVAYIRFASVYLRFQDISEFTRHVEELRRKKRRAARERGAR